MAAPCQKGLDADCFRSNPAWAKQAFAYRLVHMLVPKQLTRRLPKGLRRALLAPGVTLPPGVELPPGVVVSPGSVLPTTWSPGDPLPAGVTVAPGAVFPPGWSPGDPLPEGVTIEPGTVFPPGWSPGDPLPEGAITSPTQPPQDTGAAPPTYTGVWSPGPIRTITAPPAGEVLGDPWFLDEFGTLNLAFWTQDINGDADNTIVAGQLKQESRAGGNYAWLTGHANADLPIPFDWRFKLTIASGDGSWYAALFTGTHALDLWWDPPSTFAMRPTAGWPYTQFEVGNYMGQAITWKIKYNGTTVDVYKGNTLIVAGFEPDLNAFIKGRPEIAASSILTAYVDDFRITPI